MPLETHLLEDVWSPHRPPISAEYGGDDLTSIQTYRYTELGPGQIRLLRLAPGSWSAPIAGDLLPVDATACEPYEALSYCWGSDEKPCNILCNGTRLAVTESAVDALWRIRKRDRVRVVWIDAICIDQSNNAEKAQQVRMMGQIYNDAQQVLAWAGHSFHRAGEMMGMLQSVIILARKALYRFLAPSQVNADGTVKRHQDDLSATGMQFTDALVQQRFSALDPYEEYNGYEHLGVFEEDDRPEHVKTIHEAVDRLVTQTKVLQLHTLGVREFFERVWILQELVLAKRAQLMLGMHVMDWDQFAHAVLILTAALQQRKSKQLRMFQQKMSHIQRLFRAPFGLSGRQPVHPLVILPLIVRHHRATLPVDHLFALQALSTYPKFIEVDYEKNPADVFFFAIRSIFESFPGGSPVDYRTIFDLVTFTEMHASGRLPSWAPDYSHVSGEAVGSHQDYSAGGDAHLGQAMFLLPSEPKTLCAFGKRVGSIEEFADEVSTPEDIRVGAQIKVWMRSGNAALYAATADWRYLAALLRRDTAELGSLATDPEIREAYIREVVQICAGWIGRLRRLLRLSKGSDKNEFWRAILLPITNTSKILEDEDRAPAWARLAEAKPDLEEASNWTAEHPSLTALENKDLEDLVHIAQMSSATLVTRFARFCDGRFGWLPLESRAGDSVFILSGVRMPHIFRSAGHGRWQNLGSAYVTGIMHGEAMPSELSDLDSVEIL